MAKVGVFMADGCEEIEGLTVVDILRRAGIEVETISINGTDCVTSSHKVKFFTDTKEQLADYAAYDGIVLPGGMPGTLNLKANDTVQRVIREFFAQGKLVSAICAAPSILGEAELLKGRKATCHPGFEESLIGAEYVEQPVAVDQNTITSRGMGTTIPFALEIVRYFMDDAAVAKVCQGLVYSYR